MKYLLIILTLIYSLSGQSSDQLFFGTRPFGMGGAFVAIADDANAISWNPSGLPGLRRKEFTSTYTDLYNMGISKSYIGFVYPFSDKIAFGLDWGNIGFDDSELLYGENKIDLAIGYQPFSMFSVGINTKYIFRDMQLNGTSYGKSSGIGYDLGFLLQPHKMLRLGLSLYDLGGTNVDYENNRSETILEQALKIGIAIQPLENLKIAFDKSDRNHFGVEHVIANRLSLRLGYQQESFGSENLNIFSLGTSIKFKSIVVEYGYEAQKYLDPIHRISFALQLSPDVVSITTSQISHNPIFRSLHRYYESEPFAKIGIKNISDEDLPVDVSLFVPTMMENPHTQSVILPPKSDE